MGHGDFKLLAAHRCLGRAEGHPADDPAVVAGRRDHRFDLAGGEGPRPGHADPVRPLSRDRRLDRVLLGRPLIDAYLRLSGLKLTCADAGSRCMSDFIVGADRRHCLGQERGRRALRRAGRRRRRCGCRRARGRRAGPAGAGGNRGRLRRDVAAGRTAASIARALRRAVFDDDAARRRAGSDPASAHPRAAARRMPARRRARTRSSRFRCWPRAAAATRIPGSTASWWWMCRATCSARADAARRHRRGARGTDDRGAGQPSRSGWRSPTT